MNRNNLLILACAVSAVLAVAGCKRDEGKEAAPTAAVAPAPAPATADAPVAPAVVAPAPPVESGQPFDILDRNHDGSITIDELHTNEMLNLHFKEADTNGDGKLTPAEVDAYRAKNAAKPND